MSRSMIQAAVTMNQLQNKMDLISNNMANNQTTGYKTRQADFASLLFQQIDNMTAPANADGRSTPEGVRVGSGAKLGAVTIDLTPGSLKETERALDAALLEKNHLFQIQVTENDVTETRYTRDGSFYLSPVNGGEDVMLATKDGYPVLGANGPIIIEEGFDAITIASDGQISVQRGNVNENAGDLAVAEAVRPQLLEASGDNTFRLPDLDALAFDFAEIIQPAGQDSEILKSGVLEQSNVDIGSQMTDLINAQRSYQFNARTISMGDQMMGLVNQLR